MNQFPDTKVIGSLRLCDVCKFTIQVNGILSGIIQIDLLIIPHMNQGQILPRALNHLRNAIHLA